MTTDFTLPANAHWAMHDGHAYWQRARPDPGLLPGRRHIDPMEMPRLLPYAWLLEVHPPADGIAIPRFRFRLVGSHVDTGFGGPKTGRWLHEMEPDFNSNAAMQAGFVAVATEGHVSHRRGKPRFAMNAEAAELERLMLPLAGNGRDVDMLLGFTVFYGGDGNELRTTL
ncbi:PAS domain-containing protein [Ferrovibrio sp.]|uniref:PAS domain-containing protein n=1 Tax=Ferrovibrio sp. TaxID=1917215 RepID=UPI00262E2DF0|nr:PAS domain-containing protein [Ferrovibrio sp.]